MRMRRSPAEGHNVRHDGRGSSRLGISAIGEPAAGRDEQLGNIFRNMRLSLRLSRDAMARRLGIQVSIVDSFEAGVVTALPHWKETARIVGGYCELVRIDPEPILWRISSQLQAAAGQTRAATTRSHSPPPHASVPARRIERSTPRSGRGRRRARTLFVLTAPIALLAGAIYVAQTAPGEVYGAIRLLPDPVARPARAGFDYFMLLTAQRRDGLRWLDAGDPRSRKADKLQTGTR
ncbi:MAG TPA: helix-turn-helix domain-containing protein [Hyphomicrobiaceae bacterium]|nr:helix-turn-helix domain-containing protein [Hyphomicrobiaceae bacterium]